MAQQSAHRAVVVSDVLLYRDGVAAGLARAGAFAPICVADPSDALDVIIDRDPDVVFLDMSRPAALTLSRALLPMLAGVPIIGFGVATHGSLKTYALTCSLSIESVAVQVRPKQRANAPPLRRIASKRESFWAADLLCLDRSRT